MTSENDHNSEKNPVEKLGIMNDEMIKASKELFLPGVFETLDIKLSMSTSGGPMDIQLKGAVPFNQLSGNGITRAKMQGYSPGDLVQLAYINTSENKKLDIVSKKGGRCNCCGKILFEGDGMLVNFTHGIDASGNSHKTVNKKARLDNLAAVDPHIQSGTGFYYLICNTDSCRGKIDEVISRAIKEGNIPDQKKSSGGCFIATATFGSPLAWEVRTLYELRDMILLKSDVGKQFVTFYYRVSPFISRYISRFNLLKELSKLMLKPVIYLAKIHLNFNEKQWQLQRPVKWFPLLPVRQRKNLLMH